MLKRKEYSKLVGADTAVWLAASTTLSVTYRPGRVISPGNRLLVDALPSSLLGARIDRIIHRDVDLISGTGSVPASVFAPTSFVNVARFGEIRPEEPVVIDYSVATAPVANTSFPTCLGPLDSVTRFDIESKEKAKKTIRAIVKKKSPSWLRKLGRGIWRRMPGVAGVGAVMDDYAVQNALSEALDGSSGALDDFVDEVTGALFDEITDQAD